MTTTARQQTFAALAIAGMFAASISWGFLERDAESVSETAAARTSSANISAADPRTGVVAPSGARTQLVGLEPASGEPRLPGLRTAHQAPGAVGRVAGPFDDRFTLSRLVLRHGRVSGVVTVTSDVSDLLELQVLAGFYDAHGRLLGTGRFVHHGAGRHAAAGGSPDESEQFDVPVPRRLLPATVSAAVGVPVLVNE